MDASDIFKKLTRGTQFSKRKLKDNIPKRKTNKDVIPEIKKEPSNETPDEKVDITLLSSMAGNNGVRKRKRKHTNKVCLDDDRKRILLETEKINQYRNQNNISVVGRHIPNPAKTFDELLLEEDLINNLKSCGYKSPTPIQQQGIPILLQNRNLLACAPTGSGKTVAFLLPIINHLKEPRNEGFRALILCPTRELAKQTQRECIRVAGQRKFRVHVISKIKKALEQYGPKSSQKYDILITTPNRLCYLLKQDPPALTLKNIEWLIIDEADKLFEKGVRSFREQLDEILNACVNKDRRIGMFSATYTPAVAKWCVHNMRGLIRVTIGLRNAVTELVEQELLFVGNESGKLLAFRDLVRKGLTPPVLVFVRSKERAQQLFNELIYDGLNVDAIHADRSQSQRDNTVRSFREGRIWVLICTELMARGVDFKGINLVVNYDFPPSAIAYIHRVGRAGRAGRRGKAITFFTMDDTDNLRSIANVLKQSGCEVPKYMLAMKKPSKRRIAVKSNSKKKSKLTEATTKKKNNKEASNKKLNKKKKSVINM